MIYSVECLSGTTVQTGETSSIWLVELGYQCSAYNISMSGSWAFGCGLEFTLLTLLCLCLLFWIRSYATSSCFQAFRATQEIHHLLYWFFRLHMADCEIPGIRYFMKWFSIIYFYVKTNYILIPFLWKLTNALLFIDKQWYNQRMEYYSVLKKKWSYWAVKNMEKTQMHLSNGKM